MTKGNFCAIILYMDTKGNKVIVVEATNGATVGRIIDEGSIHIPSDAEISDSLNQGLQRIARIASGVGVKDPTEVELKHCSSCIARGRVPFHPVGEFSIVKKTGKRHSQCKKCRSEQACEWQLSKGQKRREYQKTYQTLNPRKREKPDVMQKIGQEFDDHGKASEQMNGLDAVLIVHPKES